MIKTLEKTGRTEDQAIAAALEELGMDRDDVSVEILERAKSGFLGIGASPARIRVSYEVEDPAPVKEDRPAAAPAQKNNGKKPEKKPAKKEEKKADAAAEAKAPAQKKAAPADEKAEYAEIREFLTGLLERMDVEADMEIGPRDNGGINVELSGKNMGAIIGRRGETLDAIQHLTNYVVNHGSDKRMHINIDAESYRAKREDSLSRLAVKMAEKAIKYKRSMALEPMNSYERHVIHTALQDYEGVTTASTGEEPNRRVVVTPVKTAGNAANSSSSAKKPKVKEWA